MRKRKKDEILKNTICEKEQSKKYIKKQIVIRISKKVKLNRVFVNVLFEIHKYNNIREDAFHFYLFYSPLS